MSEKVKLIPRVRLCLIDAGEDKSCPIGAFVEELKLSCKDVGSLVDQRREKNTTKFKALLSVFTHFITLIPLCIDQN